MIVRRRFGVLETLMCVPVLREFARRNPDESIMFETDYPELVELEPCVLQASRFIDHDSYVVRLDDAEERYPDMHIMDALAMCLLGDDKILDRRMELFTHPLDRKDRSTLRGTKCMFEEEGVEYIGTEGEDMYLAMTTNIPIYAVMTPARAKKIHPFRRGAPFYVFRDMDEALETSG